jgi:SAM-dependent methyltransferase
MLTLNMLDNLICTECNNISLELKSSLKSADRIIKGEIVCSHCYRKYPILEGIPNMLPDELRLKKISKKSRWREWAKRLDLFEQRIKGWTEEDSQNIIPIYDQLLRHFCTIEGSTLEIGCGNGVIRHFLERDVEYWGIDPQRSWILDPFHPFAENIFPCLKEPFPFIQGVGEHLPFQNASFDNVIIASTIDHVSSPFQVFEESYRVLKNKGLILLSVGVGKHVVQKEKYLSRMRRGIDRILSGELTSLAKSIFRIFFVDIKPDLSFTMDEMIKLFYKFSYLESRPYDSSLIFFKAQKNQISSK